MAYTTGPYNILNKTEQWIRITDGCPNQCPYCYAPKEMHLYDVPQIMRNSVKIMDMNILQVLFDKYSISILPNLPEKLNGKVIHYELICGVDYGVLSLEIAKLLFKKRFGRFNRKGKWQRGIRIAWDWEYSAFSLIQRTISYLLSAGFKKKQIEIFMICGWKIPYEECLRKLKVIKDWGCLVNDCWYDNVNPPYYQTKFWSLGQCKDFRKKCRKHNQLILFNGYDPEEKR